GAAPPPPTQSARPRATRARAPSTTAPSRERTSPRISTRRRSTTPRGTPVATSRSRRAPPSPGTTKLP
ncbi:unnamed protein product, partial [Prorocentrum cordatum]